MASMYLFHELFQQYDEFLQGFLFQRFFDGEGGRSQKVFSEKRSPPNCTVKDHLHYENGNSLAAHSIELGCKMSWRAMALVITFLFSESGFLKLFSFRKNPK